MVANIYRAATDGPPAPTPTWMRRLFPAFNQEGPFVAPPRLTGEECRDLADGPRQVVPRVEEHGEERRLELLDGAEPAPRRSGRRAKG